MKNTLKIILISCCLIFNARNASAQKLISGDTTHTKWRNSILSVRSIYIRKEQPSIKDTLTGTAILLNDGGKLYLVTTKKLLQADVYGKNQLAANDSLFLMIDYKKYLNLNGLSDKNNQKSAVVFSDDKEDIAVISLQKKAYENVVNKLLTRYQPISVKHIDTSMSMHTDDWLITYQFSDFVWPKGSKRYGTRSFTGPGAGVAQIDQYDASSYFTIKYPRVVGIRPGANGASIVANDKLIGMLCNATGFESNQDIMKTPYYAVYNGRGIKAANILQWLRKLQTMENSPEFDN